MAARALGALCLCVVAARAFLLSRPTAGGAAPRSSSRVSAAALEYRPGEVGDLLDIVDLAHAEFGKAYGDPVSRFGLRSVLTVGFFLRLTYGLDDDHRVICCRDGESGDLLGLVEVSMQPYGNLAGPMPPPQWVKRAIGEINDQPLQPYLSNLLVAPERRKAGIGGALVRACEREAARWDMPRIALHHDTEDAKLDRFYRKLGYARPDDAPDDIAIDGYVLKLVTKRVASSSAS